MKRFTFTSGVVCAICAAINVPFMPNTSNVISFIFCGSVSLYLFYQMSNTD